MPMRPLVLAATLAAALAAAVVPPAAPAAEAAVGDGVPGTLDEYWNGSAAWVFVRRDSWVSTGQPDYSYGSHVEATANGTWYFFNRFGAPAAGCPGGQGMGIQVRRSTDKGASWSAPVRIVSPAAGTPWSCYATDGDAWYDAAQNRWHYLFQCYDNVSWKGCALSRLGADPMGAFTIGPAGGNPVLTPGELWNRICNVSTDECSYLAGGPGRVRDEGTFNIFAHDGVYYWVGFHGYDGVRGYRGIAKTADFQNWLAGDPAYGLPADAVHDPNDTQRWREAWYGGQSIGGGHGSMLRDGGYWYQLVEGADRNLGCTADQNWDVGIYRSASLASSAWSQLPAGNPIVYSSKGEAGFYSLCNVQYAGLFRDPTTGFIYLTHGRRTADPNYEAVYWYRLERTRNLLVNSDLWRADVHGWGRLGGTTNYVAYRLPNLSRDGTPYLAANCGGACTGDKSIYQDVFIPGGTAGTLDYGGMFMSENGNGQLMVGVHQLDAGYRLLRSDFIPVTTWGAWAPAGNRAPLLATSRILRFQYYMQTSVTFRADDLYLRRIA